MIPRRAWYFNSEGIGRSREMQAAPRRAPQPSQAQGSGALGWSPLIVSWSTPQTSSKARRMASIVSARNTKHESDIEWLPPSNPMRARRPARETDLSVHPIHAPAMVGETAGNLVAIQQHESRNARCGCRVVPIGADARTELKRAWL